jgi:hypothetical protein
MKSYSLRWASSAMTTMLRRSERAKSVLHRKPWSARAANMDKLRRTMALASANPSPQPNP